MTSLARVEVFTPSPDCIRHVGPGNRPTDEMERKMAEEVAAFLGFLLVSQGFILST